MVWGRRWLVVLFPLLSLASAIGMMSVPVYFFMLNNRLPFM